MLREIKSYPQVLYSSPTQHVLLAEMQRPLPNGSDLALYKTDLGTSLESLNNELEIHAKLKDFPNLFPIIYDFSLDSSRPLLQYLCEYFPDGSLTNLIRGRKKLFSSKRAHILLITTLKAVSTLHRLGIAHCKIDLEAVFAVNSRKFKLGGNYIDAVQVEKLQFERGETKDKLFAKDVYDLGILWMRFFAVDASNRIQAFSEEMRFVEIDKQMRKYPEAFGEVVARMMKEMVREDASLRPSAINLLGNLENIDFKSLSSTVAGNQSLSSNRTIGNQAIIIQQPVQPSSLYISRSSMSSGGSQSSSSSVSFSLSRSMLEERKHEYNLLFSALKTMIEIRDLECEMVTNKVTDIFNKLQNTGGCIIVKLSCEAFNCSMCHSQKPTYERTLLPLCPHALCKACLNRSIVDCLMNSNRIYCRIDLIPFDPFGENIDRGLLEQGVVKKLDEMLMDKRKESCPHCGMQYSGLEDSEPVEIVCPNPECKRHFCSICKKTPHGYTVCKLWRAQEENRYQRAGP